MNQKSNNHNNNAFNSIILWFQSSFIYICIRIYVSLYSYKNKHQCLKFERCILQANKKETLLDILRNTFTESIGLRRQYRRKNQRCQIDFNLGPALICPQWLPEVLDSESLRPCPALVAGMNQVKGGAGMGLYAMKVPPLGLKNACDRQ